MLGCPPNRVNSTTEALIQGNALLARREVPHRNIDPGESLGDRSQLAGLQHKHLKLGRKLPENVARLLERAADQPFPKIGNQTCSVLGPD